MAMITIKALHGSRTVDDGRAIVLELVGADGQPVQLEILASVAEQIISSLSRGLDDASKERTDIRDAAPEERHRTLSPD